MNATGFGHVWLFGTPWAVARQAPLSVEFSRQEHWSGLLLPSLGDPPTPGTKPEFPTLQAVSLQIELWGKLKYYINIAK